MIYTDGGCEPNPGAGAWAWVRLDADGSRSEKCGSEANTTNNRMELRAAIEALRDVPASVPDAVTVYSDSRYVIDGATKWIRGWKRRGWTTTNKEPVKNRDLWEQLDAATLTRTVRWQWVRGHTGNEHNERCDTLTLLARKGLQDVLRE